jgi:hypothetical protein
MAMRSADRPSGPGSPLKEQREAVSEREGLDELAADEAGEPVDTPAEDAAEAARHAERAAHTPRDVAGTGGGGESES